MPLDPDLHDLRAFRTVAELGNFGRAAARVHLSQPAFSRRIAKLEETLGVKLLERTTRRVTLTAVGREFARTAAGLLDDLDASVLALRGVTATRSGEVTVACVPSTVYYYFPEVIRRWREQAPRVRVKVLDAGANEVLAAVSRGEADFGLNFIGAQEADIVFEPLVTERFVAACRRDHPLARSRSLTWRELAPHDFITVAKTSGNRLLIDQALAGKGGGMPQPIYEAEHVTTMLGLVEAGLGVAVVPSMAMPRHEHPALVSVALKDPVVARKVGLIRRRGRSLSPAAQQLYAMFMSMKRRRA